MLSKALYIKKDVTHADSKTFGNIHMYAKFDQNISSTTERERSGSVVECLTRDRRAAGSSLTGVTALCP